MKALIREMAEAFEERTRDDGTKFVALEKGSPQWMTDIIFKCHQDRMPDDDIYSRISDILDTFSDVDSGDYDDYQDRISEIEPDMYTADLTGWLASNINNVYYLTQALEEFDQRDGFSALAMAQKLYIDEIAYTLLNEIQNITLEKETA